MALTSRTHAAVHARATTPSADRRWAAGAVRPLASTAARRHAPEATSELVRAATSGRPRLAPSPAARDEAGGGAADDGSRDHSFPPLDNPALHDLFFGMGSSGAPGERPADAEDPLSSEAATEALHMGSWRLRPLVCPEIQALVAQLEGGWREALGSDLSLCPLPSQYRYMDSVDPDNRRTLAYQLPSPSREDPGWPRLQVENRAYQSHAFRKMHLEVAVRQDGLQVLHCVLYPRPQFELPILSLDLVAANGRVTLAVVDPCPVSRDLSLPRFYNQPVVELQQRYGVETNRSIPEWGAAIFSPLCVCMRPTSPAEVAAFLKYAIALSSFHTQIGRLIGPVGTGSATGGVQRRLDEIRAAHQRYSARQLENDKTRRVLEKAFGAAAADEYMTTVMFDVPDVLEPGPTV